MRLEEILDLMKHSPWNFYWVGTGHRNNPDEEWAFEAYDIRHKQLDYIGSVINTVPLPYWWTGIDTYDFTRIDKYVKILLDGHPERFFVPRLYMEPPLDWQKANPEELCVYWNGLATAEEISAMVGTSYQDLNGWDDDKKPYPDQRIAQQSFSSKRWIHDASIALKMVIEHFENGPYSKQFIGYMVAFGNCGECMWWGDWRNQGDPRKGDFGIGHKKRFYEWLMNKYGSLEKLREAWGLPELTAENLTVPSPLERWSEDGKNLRGVLLADDQRQVDCNEFHSDACFDAIEAFGKVIKETSGKASGCFYGYFQDETAGYAGHLATKRAMTTSYVDFYSSPKGYHYCLAGEPGSSQAPGQSFSLKKLWIEENDCRSHHSDDEDRKADNAEDTETVFWREIYRALTFGQGFWWMDIGGVHDDWYTDSRMVEMFRRQADFFKKQSRTERNGVAEVLFVEDEASCAHMTYLSGVQRSCRLRLERELRLCGIPVDHLRISDLLESDMSRYKFIVFCHAFVMPKDLWQKILARIRRDAHILWNYAAGLLDPSFNPENQKAVTGFNTEERKIRMRHRDLYRHIYWHAARRIPQDYPLLNIVAEEGQEVLQKTPDGCVLTARVDRGDGKNIFAADFTLRVPLLRRLLADANVEFFAPEYCSVLADDKLVGFFPKYDCRFDYNFEGDWKDVISGEFVTGKQTLSVFEKRFRIFEKI